MNMLTSLDWYIFIAPFILLPIAMLPSFVGCSFFVSAPESADQQHVNIAGTLKFKIAIHNLTVRERIDSYKSNEGVMLPQLHDGLDQLLPPVGGGPLPFRLELNITANVTIANDARVKQPENKLPVEAIFIQDSAGNRSDYIMQDLLLPVSVENFEVLLSQQSIEDASESLTFNIVGDLPIDAQNSMRLFEGIAIYPLPEDLNFSDYIAYFNVADPSRNIIVPNDAFLRINTN